jgi:lipoprotein NlpI
LLSVAIALLLAQGPPRPALGDGLQAIFDRAIADFMSGRVRASADGFDNLAELLPDSVPQLWQRGIALYYEGRYKECAKQFALHRAVNPTDAENVAWHFVCVARAESAQKARTSVLSIVPDSRIPMPELYDLLRGLTTPERLMDAALSTGKLEAEFDAHLYLGLYFEALGDSERTRIHITAAASDRFNPIGGFMHAAAKAHLRQLQVGAEVTDGPAGNRLPRLCPILSTVKGGDEPVPPESTATRPWTLPPVERGRFGLPAAGLRGWLPSPAAPCRFHKHVPALGAPQRRQSPLYVHADRISTRRLRPHAGARDRRYRSGWPLQARCRQRCADVARHRGRRDRPDNPSIAARRSVGSARPRCTQGPPSVRACQPGP